MLSDYMYRMIVSSKEFNEYYYKILSDDSIRSPSLYKIFKKYFKKLFKIK